MSDNSDLLDLGILKDIIDYSERASIGLLKRIPSGSVRMGSKFHPREFPPHTVRVREFELAHVAVTVSQYTVFILDGGYSEQNLWSEEGWAWRRGETENWGRKDRKEPYGWGTQKRRSIFPITGVTKFEAEAYCNWIGKIKSRPVRLPTEQEWERAARGDDTRPFPWGEDFEPERTNTKETERASPVNAGSLVSDISPFGIYDMAGNVQEWTESVYDPLPDEDSPAVVQYVARGGSFVDTAFGSRTSYRRAYPPGFFFPHLGFRLAVGVRRQK